MQKKTSEKQNVRKGLRFQKAVYAVLHYVVGPFVRLFYRFRGVVKPKSKIFLLLSNHCNGSDPVVMVVGIRAHYRFVATASIMEGFFGGFVKALFGPIPRKKGASADETVRLIEENLKAGVNVAMYPEGSRTWDGETAFIPPRTAELVKSAGVALVTYRMHGQFLKKPRYASHKRTGPSWGEIVHEYSAEELAKMSVDEIYAHIREDLYVNAFEDQKKAPATYRGKAKAEGIESILYLCPKCGGIGTIRGEGERFTCSCGLAGEVDERGFLSGDLPFDNTAAWNRWQKETLKARRAALLEEKKPLFVDKNATVLDRTDDAETVLFENAEIEFYGDRITAKSAAGELTVPLSSIRKLSAFGRKRVFLSDSGHYYEFRFPHTVSGIKYDALWRVLTGKAYY